MGVKANLVKKLVPWLLPSEWVEALKGKKRILGAIALVLWAAIYAAPVVFPQYAFIAGVALQVQEILTSAGIDLNTELAAAGAGLTVIGLIDWVWDHILSDGLAKLLQLIEKPARKLVDLE